MKEINYIGKELELFQHAVRWKNYYGRLIKSYLKGRILEVGAGIGSTTQSLCDGSQELWHCLEPDPTLYLELKRKIDTKALPGCCSSLKGTIQDIKADEKYDAILYIDVIEHIENDAAELNRAKEHLKNGGYLIVLVPAHHFLYSPFDKTIGHYRRYNKTTLKQVVPGNLKSVFLKYLDSAGLIALFMNKMVLRQTYPGLRQIKFWDNLLIPLSGFIDPVIGHTTGKTLLGVWQKL